MNMYDFIKILTTLNQFPVFLEARIPICFSGDILSRFINISAILLYFSTLNAEIPRLRLVIISIFIQYDISTTPS